MKFYSFFLLLLFLNAKMVQGQNSAPSNSFQYHYDLALQYENVSLFAESIDEINNALKIAKKSKAKKHIVEASILLAEIKRKTGDFNQGIQILRSLKSSENYPQLHIEKLGRMAALFHESNMPDKQKFDSVELYLKRALILVEKYDFQLEKASLYNELGYRIGHKQLDSCLYLLGEASRIFLAEKDTQNYIGARTNMLRTYETIGDSINTLKTFNELNELLQGKNWFTLERELFSTISIYYAKRKDTLQSQFWQMKSQQSQIKNIETISSLKLNSFRALYETQKYKEAAERNSNKLKEEKRRRNDLILYVTLLLLLIIGVTLLLFRERILKRKIAVASDNYQVLLVESNHRIKNNLQMIISMLQYASKDAKEEDVKAYKNMSGKIKTISELHKHLCIDVHNELVDLKSYFSAILALYVDPSSTKFQVEIDMDEIAIKSERIIYFGLALNEMLANTFEQETSKLQIRVKAVGTRCQFTYQDFSISTESTQKGTGIALIEQLVQRVKGQNFQLDPALGKFDFDFEI